MGDINLTKILFAGLVSTFLVGAMFGLYIEFITVNNVQIDEQYNEAFSGIANEYLSLSNVSKNVSDQGVVKNILDFGKNAITGTVNVFVMGLDAIGSFFSLIPVLESVISILKKAIPGIDAVLGLFTTIFIVYIAMRYIKSASNKQDLP